MVNIRLEEPETARMKRKILEYVAFRVSKGKSPSYKEIAKHCEYPSVGSLAMHYIRPLIEDGWLTYRPRRPRSLKPTRPWWQYPIPDDTD